MKTYISEDAFLLLDWKENKMKNSNEEIEILFFFCKSIHIPFGGDQE